MAREVRNVQVTVRIYIEDLTTFKTVVVTSLMNVAQVTDDIRQKALLSDNHEWALFEVVSDFNLGTCRGRSVVLSYRTADT
jgi:hypothetical protein